MDRFEAWIASSVYASSVLARRILSTAERLSISCRPRSAMPQWRRPAVTFTCAQLIVPQDISGCDHPPPQGPAVTTFYYPETEAAPAGPPACSGGGAAGADGRGRGGGAPSSRNAQPQDRVSQLRHTGINPLSRRGASGGAYEEACPDLCLSRAWRHFGNSSAQHQYRSWRHRRGC
jgi:hypothetical protein